MSKKSKNKKSKGKRTPGPRKMSEMISEIGGGFIGLGETVEDRYNRLNAVCSAWNMACAAPELRERQLEQYLKGFRQFNSDHTEEQLSEVRRTMEAFIECKLQKFPADQRQIVDAMIIPFGENVRIEIASATVH